MTDIIKDEYGCHIYIECLCSEFDHLVRLNFYRDEDEEPMPVTHEFHLEFKHNLFPSLPKGKWISGKFIWAKMFWNYIVNVWYAIKGKPNTYSTVAYWEREQAEQIRDFIDYCLTKYKKG